MELVESQLLQSFDRFEKILELYRQIEKIPYDYGTGEALYLSEIHMIARIDEMRCANVSALAESLGVSRAAASKLSTRLERKGYLTKRTSPESNKVILVELTELGQRASDGHREFHAKGNHDMAKAATMLLSSMAEADAKRLLDGFDLLLTLWKSSLEENIRRIS